MVGAAAVGHTGDRSIRFLIDLRFAPEQMDDGDARGLDLAIGQSACVLAALECGLLLQLPAGATNLACASAAAPGLINRLLQLLRTMGWV